MLPDVFNSFISLPVISMKLGNYANSAAVSIERLPRHTEGVEAYYKLTGSARA